MSERVLAIRKVDDVIGTVRYCPDPEAPSVSEVGEVLRNASNMIEWSGVDERMDDYSTLNRIDNLIARLEGRP